jgi:hypothetical protein
MALNEDILKKRYDKLFQDGKLVYIHVGKWSMRCSLSKEDLEINEDLPSIFKLGNKVLIDPSIEETLPQDERIITKFGSIEALARRYLAENSFDFKIAYTHFVPKKKIVDVLNKLIEYKRAFEINTTKFIENYDSYRDATLTKHSKYRELLEPYYPHANELHYYFNFELSVFEVTFPKKIDTLNFETLLAKQAVYEDTKKTYELEMEAQYNKAINRMNDFVSESAKALRSQVIECFENLAFKIKKGEIISTRNINSIRGIVDNFKSLDFFDDTEVDKGLNTVMELVNENNDFKDNQEATERLGIALNNVLEVANNMTDIDTLTGEYFRKLDV